MRKIIVTVIALCLLCTASCAFRTTEEYPETQFTPPRSYARCEPYFFSHHNA